MVSLFFLMWLLWQLIQTTQHTSSDKKQLHLVALSKLASLWATCYQLLTMEVKLKEEIKVLPPFSFPFFLRRTVPCTCSSSGSVHLAYIYRVHKCNNNPLNAPCGHWAGKQMLDFTSKIEPSRGNLNKTVYWHIKKTMKRGTMAHIKGIHVDAVSQQQSVIRQVKK